MIAFAEIQIGTGQVPACSTCARAKAAAPAAALPLDAVRSNLASTAHAWIDGPGPNVSFVGFEPFAHPELPALVASATDAGYTRIRLRTDAGALARAGNAEGVLRAGVRHLEVVLLADADEHDRLTGRAGLFSAASEGVRVFVAAARSAGLAVAVTGLVPVCRHNAAFAPAAIARLAALGAVAVHVDAAACPDRDLPLVLAALDTAATNAMAGSASGVVGDVPAPWGVRPWRLTEMARA